MTRVLTIAAREIQDKAFVFIVAAALSLQPFLFLFAKSGTRAERLSAALVFGVILGMGFTVALALVLGMSMIGREAREKRLSFYFSRPIGGAAIWFGKLLAALVSLLISVFIVFLPAALLAPVRARDMWSLGLPEIVAFAMGTSILALIASHAAGTMLRSRSAWVVLDVLAAAVIATATIAALLPFALHGAMPLLAGTVGILLVLLAAILVGAGAWQLARGRTDVARHHRELSGFLWGSLGAVVLLLVLFSWWVVSVTPADLEKVNVEQGPSGSMAYVMGKARHRGGYVSLFFVNAANGKYATASAGEYIFFDSPVNDTGTAAVSLETSALDLLKAVPMGRGRSAADSHVTVLTPDGSGIRRIETGIVAPTSRNYSDKVKLSDDAKRLAMITTGTLVVYDIPSKRTLAAVKLPLREDERVMRIRLMNDGTASLVTSLGKTGSDQIRAWVYKPQQRALTLAFETVSDVPYTGSAISEDGNRLLLSTGRRGSQAATQEPSGAVRLIDLTTGRAVTTIMMPPDARTFGSWLLRDGRLAVMVVKGRSVSVQTFAANGAPLGVVDLGTASRANIYGEQAAGKLLVTTLAPSAPALGKVPGNAWSTHIVDVDRGAVTASARGLLPGWHHSLRAGATIGSAGGRLFMDENDRTVTWNPATGERKAMF